MASGPAKQLNSKKIRSALISTVLKTVKGCSLISSKISFNTGERGSVEETWKEITKKRDECDQALKKVKGMAFFFSAIGSKEVRPRKTDEANNSQEGPVAEKMYHPAISYWLVLKSVNGMQVSTVPIHEALLEIGVEVDPKSLPSCVPGKEENCASPLCQIVKDHNNSFIQGKIDASFQYGMQQLQSQLCDEPIGSPTGSERVVRLQVISPEFKPTLTKNAIPALAQAGMVFDVFGIELSNNADNTTEPSQDLASPIGIALNDVERAMSKLGYSLYHGEVYKKVPTAKFTYEYCSSVKKFLSILGRNRKLRETVLHHSNQLVHIMGDRESEMCEQLTINYDLIEVRDGWCYSISNRKFVKDAIEGSKGKITPRAFVDYDHTKNPAPGFFQSILENSLDEEEISHFCEYYLRLLNHGGKQHKERVLCLVGEPNSGKTSLFTPLTAVIPRRYIAMITKQRAFNKSMIDEDTQIIFLDEAYSKMLDPDDWKMLTQGGISAYDRKYKSAAPLEIRCPIFITCQTEMDFGAEHNEAMEVRLQKFHFKRLSSTNAAGVQDYLKSHVMDCLVWASTKAVTPIDELPLNTSRAHDGPLDEDEKERIRLAQLEDSESEENEQTIDGSREEEEGEVQSDGESVAEDVLPRLSEFWDRNLSRISKEREKVPKQSLKERQLALIGAEVRNVMEEEEKDVHDRESRFLEETRRRWVSLGMIREEDAHLLDKIGGPYHPNIERTREEYFLRKREEEMQELEEKARKFYEDDWVLQKEQELIDLQKQEDAATDQDVKRALQYMIGVAEEALKLNFKKVEVPGLAKLVLEERRRKCVEMGWTSTQQTQWICTIWQSLPYPCEASPRREEESDEEEIFLTQQPARSQDSGFRESAFLNDEGLMTKCPPTPSIKETVDEFYPLSPGGAATPRWSPTSDPDFVPPTPSGIVRPIEDYSLPSTWGGIPVNSPKRPTKRKSNGKQRAGKRSKCLPGQKTMNNFFSSQ